jgi:hypothetical protein
MKCYYFEIIWYNIIWLSIVYYLQFIDGSQISQKIPAGITILTEFLNKFRVVFMNFWNPIHSAVYEPCNALKVIVDRGNNMYSIDIGFKLYVFASRTSFYFYIQ